MVPEHHVGQQGWSVQHVELLVDRMDEADPLRPPEQTGRQHRDGGVVGVEELQLHQQDVGQAVGLEPLPRLADVGLAELLVSVDAQNPAAAGTLDRLVAVEGEVVPPGLLEDLGAEVPRDRRGVVGRAGVENHDLVGQRSDALETAAEVLGLVANDQAGAHQRRSPGLAHRASLMPKPAAAGKRGDASSPSSSWPLHPRVISCSLRCRDDEGIPNIERGGVNATFKKSGETSKKVQRWRFAPSRRGLKRFRGFSILSTLAKYSLFHGPITRPAEPKMESESSYLQRQRWVDFRH